MTKAEDLPLVERDEISTVWPVKRYLWEQREILAIRNKEAARNLAYATTGAGSPDNPRYRLEAEPSSIEFVEDIIQVPGDMFGIKYTWKVVSVDAG